MFKKLKYLLSLIIVFPLVTTGCSCNDNGLKKITVAEVTHSIFYAPQYLADSLGFFKDEGLDVSFVNTNGADKTMAALLSKDAQIGLMGPEASMYVYLNGQKDYAINFAQLTQKDGSFLVGRENIDNFDISMLNGKEILGGRKAGMPEMVLEYILKSNGLEVGRDDPSKDVYVRTDVQFAAMAGAFVSGEGDYVSLFEPTASNLEKAGNGYIVASLGELSGNVAYTAYSALKSYIDKNEDVIQKFTNAIYKAQTWIYSHTDEEVANAIKGYFSDTTINDLKTAIYNYRKIEAWSKTPILSEESLNKLMDIVELAGELPSRVSYSKIVTTKFANNVK
ncbi:MAG: ABC transporter substrate-binding protein [Bacilli bacterium]|nr:ABC transporter substrate-binding protein [Bacilli bacterium]